MRDVRTELELREQRQFERAQRAQYEARIVKAARDNPDLTIDLLCERFCETRGAIQHILERHRVSRPRPDERITPWARVRRTG